MKILHVYKTFYPDSYGGVELVIDEIAKYSHEQKIEVTVLVPSANVDKITITKDKCYILIRCPENIKLLSSPFSISLYSKYKEIVNDYDLIHFHFPWPYLDLINYFIKTDAPKVCTYHSDIIKQKYAYMLYKPLMRTFLSAMNTIVATSENYAATSTVLQKYKNKLAVIELGIEESSEPNKVEIEKVRSKYGEDFILFIGQLRYYKGLKFLLKAMRNLPQKLIIAGSGYEQDELKKLAVELNLKNVNFIGKVTNNEKIALYRLSRVVVLPSHLRSEAFGLVLVEALMHAKPLVSCEIGTGTSFVNKHDETGFVVRPKDSAQLAEAIQKLYDDQALYEQFSKAARARYEKLFTASKMGQKYVNLYQKLLKT